MIRGGARERFCQQCSRFHSVDAFEGGKRSCRTQLARHNARRRKRAAPATSGSNAPDAAVQAKSEAKAEVDYSSSGTAMVKSEPMAGAAATAVPAAHMLPWQATAAGPRSTPCGALSASTHYLHERPAAAAQPQQLQQLPMHGICNGPPAPALQPDMQGRPAAALVQDLLRDPASAAALRRVLAAPADPAAEAAAAPALASARPAGAMAPADAAAALRVSMKLFHCRPSDLPPDLSQHLASWLPEAPVAVSGAIRPGCVFLTATFTISLAAARAAVAAGAASLAAHLCRHAVWQRMRMVLQVGGSVCKAVVCCRCDIESTCSCMYRV